MCATDAADRPQLDYGELRARLVRVIRRHWVRATAADAEDLVQNVLACFFTAIKKGRAIRNVEHWFLRVARNAAITAGRRANRRMVSLSPQMFLLDTRSAETASRTEPELLTALTAAIASLGERERDVIQLQLRGRTLMKIAEERGVSCSTVYKVRVRALRELRARLSAWTGDESAHEF